MVITIWGILNQNIQQKNPTESFNPSSLQNQQSPLLMGTTNKRTQRQRPLRHDVTAAILEYRKKILSGLNSSSCKLFSTFNKFALQMIASVKTIYTIIVDQVFQNFMFFFPRKERESFVRKVLVLEPSSLYKVDLKRVQQAGTDVSEDCDKEDVQTARW